MHMDVLRRAIELKYDEIQALNIGMYDCIGDADRLVRPLPDLPFEVIRRIFSFLYRIDVLQSYGEGQTTLMRFMADSPMDDGWNDTIRKDIPVLVSDYSPHRIRMLTQHVVGPHPKQLSMLRDKLEINRLVSSPGTEVSILLGTDPPDEGIQNLLTSRKIRWENLFIDSFSHDADYTPEFLNACRTILPQLRRLEISHSVFNAVDHEEATRKAAMLRDLQLVQRNEDDELVPWRLLSEQTRFDSNRAG